MLALIVVANPGTTSFSNAMADVARQVLSTRGYEVAFLDLYAEKFDPVQPTGEIANTVSSDSAIEQYCAELARADLILIFHPNWWGQPPAILKGWVDRVFRLGTAYAYPPGVGPEGVPAGLLHARHALVFNTSNTPPEREATLFGDPLETLWKRCIFGLCGVKSVVRRMVSPVAGSTPEQRAGWLEEVRTLVHKCAVADDAAVGAPWLPIALAEVGVAQFPAGQSNPRITQYHEGTDIRGYDDKASWCSSFVNWCLGQVGIGGTGSALARSWLEWGEPLALPVPGCIVVLSRDDPNSWKGHVGFYLRSDEKFIYLLGGNQLEQVREHFYPVESVLAYRWPMANPLGTEISMNDTIQAEEVVELYAANGWSSAEKPIQLMAALRNSHALVTARRAGRLVGIGNAISDGHLVVYYPHMLVHPAFQGQGIGRQMMAAMLEKYAGFHQQMLTADGRAIAFYQSLGFVRAGNTEPMWVYAGDEH